MKFLKQTRIAAYVSAVLVAAAPSLMAQLTKVDIAPTNTVPTAGTYTPGASFTITGDGTGFFPPSVNAANAGDVGDVMTFAYETVTGDFDRRVRITSISSTDPADRWTRGALQARTSTNSYSTSLQLFASNPEFAPGGGMAAFVGRALDGQNYTWFSRNNYNGVTNALPNQWLRLRRVGDYFSAYVGTNGTSWTLIGQRYQVLPATMVVGPYAASGAIGTIATVGFASYGATPLNDAISPALVSAGTLDKKVVGVKFSEAVNSTTAKVIANYQVTQAVGGPVTITSVKPGISGDAVYLAVTGLTADTFTVKVVGGIQDTAGNTISPNVQVAARALNWNHGDQGYIQDTTNRPKPGDDPGTVGQAVMISSDENPEVEIVGGGSNSWDPGDFIHYIWRTTPLSGNFDVTVAVSRNDRPANANGWGNSGIMLRAAFQNTTNTDGSLLNPNPTALTNLQATKVQMVLNTTYTEGAGVVSGPGRGAIPLWRTATFGGYGNGNAGFGAYGNVIGGVKGYYSELRGIDASGNIDPQSIPDSARYLRIKRVGTEYTFYASWNRTDWALVHGPQNLPDLPDQLLLGFSTMNDTGGSNPPFSAYGGNGHELDPADPYNPINTGRTDGLGNPIPGNVQNDSNYAVQRIKIFPNGVSDPLPVALALADIRPADGDVDALSGSWTSTGTSSFNMTGGGTSGNAPYQNLAAPAFDGTTGGDTLSFAYEQLTGDFDKQIQITSLTNSVYLTDGVTPWDYSSGEPPVDTWTRAGLMVRTDTNSYNACLAILAGNPVGANVVRVIGHPLDGARYRDYSSDYPGVASVIPNQYLRMKRVGNNFSFYVSKDGVVWSMICQQYVELPNQVLFGPYVAASLASSSGALSRAVASFSSYNDVETGDVAAPVLLSVGTIDKKTIGVKFSEPLSSASATVLAKYSLSQGTVTGAKLGISGDAVYLTVSGLTADTFTVTVTNVTDTSGNKLAGSQSANGKVSAWTATDIGYIQTPANRPTPGDDPYRVGTAVATTSEDGDTSELEVIGGGSNAWDGDYINYVYDTTPLTGDFEVTCKITRYDKPYSAGGNSDHAGLMLRPALYNAGEDYTVEGTKVPYMSMMTYHPRSSGPLPLWRDAAHAFGSAGGQIPWTTVIGGLIGYIPEERATNSAGVIDAQSSPYQAFWLRIKRTGSNYDLSASWDGKNWQLTANSPMVRGVGTGPLLLGYYHSNDSGDRIPPFSGYLGQGHTIIPGDPLGVTDFGHSYQNEGNYTVSKVRVYKTSSSIGAIKVSKAGSQVSIAYSGTLVTSTSLNGPWTVVPQQGSPYLTTPSGTRFYRVIP